MTWNPRLNTSCTVHTDTVTSTISSFNPAASKLLWMSPNCMYLFVTSQGSGYRITASLTDYPYLSSNSRTAAVSRSAWYFQYTCSMQLDPCQLCPFSAAQYLPDIQSVSRELDVICTNFLCLWQTSWFITKSTKSRLVLNIVHALSLCSVFHVLYESRIHTALFGKC